MKKTLGLTALSVSLAAAGCALLPHTGVKPAGDRTFGPITVHVSGLPYAGSYAAQALRSTAQQVHVEVRKTNALGVDVGPADTTTGNNGLSFSHQATASVSGGAATVALPIIKFTPTSSGYYLVVYVFSDKANHRTLDTAARNAVVMQGESFIHPTPGVPLEAAVTLENTIANAALLSNYPGSPGPANAYAPAIQTSFTGISSTTSGLDLRMANWDWWYNTRNNSGAASHSLRVSITSTSAYSSSLASGSSYGWWEVGCPEAASTVSATQSFGAFTFADATASTPRRTIYADLDLLSAAATTTFVPATNASASASGSIVFHFTQAMTPSGYKINISDNASPSSTAANAGF